MQGASRSGSTWARWIAVVAACAGVAAAVTRADGPGHARRGRRQARRGHPGGLLRADDRGDQPQLRRRTVRRADPEPHVPGPGPAPPAEARGRAWRPGPGVARGRYADPLVGRRPRQGDDRQGRPGERRPAGQPQARPRRGRIRRGERRLLGHPGAARHDLHRELLRQGGRRVRRPGDGLAPHRRRERHRRQGRNAAGHRRVEEVHGHAQDRARRADHVQGAVRPVGERHRQRLLQPRLAVPADVPGHAERPAART